LLILKSIKIKPIISSKSSVFKSKIFIKILLIFSFFIAFLSQLTN